MYLSKNTAVTGMCIITEESKKDVEKEALPYFRSLYEHPHYMDRGGGWEHIGHNNTHKDSPLWY